MTAAEVDEAVEEVVRTSYGRLVAYLASITGDIAAAEDALSDAFVAAIRTWPTKGIPDRPTSWMLTAARRSLIGTHRRTDVARRANPTLALLGDERAEATMDAFGDKRVELLFTCAHPAIDPTMHAPLMLQAVLGLDAKRIASAFLVPAPTLGQRLVRAKQKIRDAGIPFIVPDRDDLHPRVAAVHDAIYAAFGTGWDDPLGTDPKRRGLAEEALRLAEVVCELLPQNAESHGLAALLLHSDARSAARRDREGRFVALGDQDVSLWSSVQIEAAERHLRVALELQAIGPYQLQGAIQSLHNRRALTGSTDWLAIRQLYDGLASLEPSSGVLVARAAAILESEGADASVAALDALDDHRIATYQPYWVVLAEALERGAIDHERRDAARERALELTDDPSVDAYLTERFR